MGRNILERLQQSSGIPRNLILDLVYTEFDMALTFCRIAASADVHSDKRLRNIKNAHQAYRGALKAVSKVHLTPVEWSSLLRLDGQVRRSLLDLVPNGKYAFRNKNRP